MKGWKSLGKEFRGQFPCFFTPALFSRREEGFCSCVIRIVVALVFDTTLSKSFWTQDILASPRLSLPATGTLITGSVWFLISLKVSAFLCLLMDRCCLEDA